MQMVSSSTGVRPCLPPRRHLLVGARSFNSSLSPPVCLDSLTITKIYLVNNVIKATGPYYSWRLREGATPGNREADALQGLQEISCSSRVCRPHNVVELEIITQRSIVNHFLNRLNRILRVILERHWLHTLRVD